jgi:UDP-glucose 4-epimerase
VQRINTNPISSLENNIKGTEIILKEAAKFNVRTIFASTSEIYGKNINVPLTEKSDRVLGQTNIARWTYSESKAINEFYALELFHKEEFPVTIVRFFNTVGPRQSEHYGMVMPRFINSALRNEPIVVYGDGKQTRSFCAVTDAVSAIQLLMANSASIGEVYNLGSDSEISILELAKIVLTLTNSNSKIVCIEQAEVFGNNFEEPRRRVPDISKIRQAIDWKPTRDVTDIILQIVSYIKSSSHSIK